ncbi:MAG: hypothetical protein NVS4B10_02280 [Myxococcales bacterium]
MSALAHDEVQELLAAFADGELGTGSREEVDAHLSGCARCRAALSVQRQFHTRLSRMHVPEASSPLLEQIRARLHEPGKARARELRRRATTWSGWAVAAALALIVGSKGCCRAGRRRLLRWWSPPWPITAATLAASCRPWPPVGRCERVCRRPRSR